MQSQSPWNRLSSILPVKENLVLLWNSPFPTRLASGALLGLTGWTVGQTTRFRSQPCPTAVLCPEGGGDTQHLPASEGSWRLTNEHDRLALPSSCDRPPHACMPWVPGHSDCPLSCTACLRSSPSHNILTNQPPLLTTCFFKHKILNSTW